MQKSFFLDIDPPTRTAQQKGAAIQGGHIRHYVKREVREAQEILRAALRPHRPPQPIAGAVELAVEFNFVAKSHKPGTWRSTRPDLDNLLKGLVDCMTATGFWNDDAQVSILHGHKQWSEHAGIYISIRELEARNV